MPLALILALHSQALSVVSAASYVPGTVAPEMIATAFSTAITAQGGYSITVNDAAVTVFGQAAGQISFLVPSGLTPGDVTVTLREQDRVLATTVVRSAAVSPGIFTANASGAGAPAALVNDNGAISPLFVAAAGGGFLPRPFQPGPVYLLLFGTGIRGWRGEVTATIGGRPAPVAAAVAQGEFAGLDQVNVGPLPAFADRRGEADVVVTVDGVAANPVIIAVGAPDAGAWSTRSQLLEANSEMAVGELAGKVFVLGGYPASRQTQSSVQVYDPAEDRWERTAPMPIGLNHNMAASTGGKLYMIGGQTTDAGAGNFSDRVFEYDPATRAWRERARMPAARGAGVAVVAGGKIYVAAARQIDQPADKRQPRYAVYGDGHRREAGPG
ncbi:MAG: hypothetical protein ACRD44_14275, partial [Bryobacteraceae bacterium]